MRFSCGLTIFIFFFLTVNSNGFAQVGGDSVPQGVIKIKRPPVKADYRVSIVYFYPDSSRNNKHISEFSTNQIVFGDSVFNPLVPQPFVDFRSVEDAIISDSATRPKSRGEKPASSPGAFDWRLYLASMHYQFAWADSSKSDSAQFQFTIDKRGNATCKAIPWKNADSTCRAFEKKSLPYLHILDQWFPAKKIKRNGGDGRQPRLKNVSSIVLITVYAFDPYAGRLMPIETIIGN